MELDIDQLIDELKQCRGRGRMPFVTLSDGSAVGFRGIKVVGSGNASAIELLLDVEQVALTEAIESVR